MRAKRTGLVVLGYAITAFLAATYASSTRTDRGLWPADWPRELNKCRSSAVTTRIVGEVQENIYEIRFATQAEFERLWPVLLRVKSPNGTLTLLSPPAGQGLGTVPEEKKQPVVRIIAPVFSALPGEESDTLQPPMPWDSVQWPNGELPEYVTDNPTDHTWIAWNEDLHRYRIRARTDVELVVDGRIVDLDRIPLPGDTPILDKRELAVKLPPVATRPAAEPKPAPPILPPAVPESKPSSTSEQAAAEARSDYDRTLARVQAMTRKIVPGRRRVEVEKVLRYREDSSWGVGWSRYYEGSDVMVCIHYDETGGKWSGENRVTAVEFWRESPQPVWPPPIGHMKRWMEAARLAGRISVGTTRAEVNKLFPHEDGGLSGPRATRYYAGDEVMVEVYYDQTGGNWKPENRVTDSPHIYRARQAMD